MADDNFSVDDFFEALKPLFIEAIERLSEASRKEVLAGLPGWCEEIVWNLSACDPDEANQLGLEIRRKVGVAVLTWKERDKQALIGHLRTLLHDVDDTRASAPENN
jgi:hypothetical protein